jgi:hypothetical protein
MAESWDSVEMLFTFRLEIEMPIDENCKAVAELGDDISLHLNDLHTKLQGQKKLFLMCLILEFKIFRVIVPCSVSVGFQRFRERCWLQHHEFYLHRSENLKSGMSGAVGAFEIKLELFRKQLENFHFFFL